MNKIHFRVYYGCLPVFKTVNLMFQTIYLYNTDDPKFSKFCFLTHGTVYYTSGGCCYKNWKLKTLSTSTIHKIILKHWIIETL